MDSSPWPGRIHANAHGAPRSPASYPRPGSQPCGRQTTRRSGWRSSRRTRVLFACSVLSCLWHLPSSAAAAQPGREYRPDESHLTGQFLHITDIHPDEHYFNGGTISSSCHRASEGDDEDQWRMMRPGRKDGGVGGMYGSPYSICDSPFALTNATFDWIDRTLIGKIDFVVWSGDNARHDSDNMYPRTQTEIEDLNMKIANKFLETFAPEKDDPFQRRIPIVPSIGNNDVYPHNIMQAGPNRILQHFSNIWSEFIPESQYHTFQNGGYFTVEVVPGKISVVSLNTLYFFNQNAAVDGCESKDEPGTDQMDWLEVELDSYRKRGMTAYLTGHVPPARKSYSSSCFLRYTEIALRYQDVIVGHLYGHANIDHFFILSQATLDEEDGRKKEVAAAEAAGDSAAVAALKNTQDGFEYEFDQFHTLGLNSYLMDLWEQYEDIPKRAKVNDYAIVNVSPSIVPTYNPTLRVYAYQLAIETSGDMSVAVTLATPLGVRSVDEDEEEDGEELDDIASDYDYGQDDLGKKKKKEKEKEKKKKEKKKKEKKKKKKEEKKKKKPANPPAVPPTMFGFPLNYTQYWVNLTQANLEETQPDYVVEYRSQEDWGMKDLSVSEWLGLAKRIVENSQDKEKYLAWMVVLTGTENEHYI